MVRQERRPLQQTNLFYAQAANNPIKKDEDKDTADPQEKWPPSEIHAQVDKKRSKKKEVSEDPPFESGDVYSVVNKPSSPQKSELLLDELNIIALCDTK